MKESTNTEDHRHSQLTNLNMTLEATAKREQYDKNAKAILSHKIMLAWVLKTCVSEFKDFSISFIEHQCIEGTLEVGTKAAHRKKCLEEDFQIPMSTEIKEAMEDMSSFCDFYIEYGEARGEARGEVRGEARGEIKGVIRFCHDKMHYSVDAIIEAIREQFNLTQEEAEKYIEQTLQLQKI